jgi:1-deoxy-D-xylulose-5-phosphate synthase
MERSAVSTLLETIRSPKDLAGLGLADLERLAAEVRALITETVAARGGHLASNLGVVDLVIALHRVFDFSRDHLVLDVGHQCYAHKILTGRREGFSALRTAGGVSGFPSPRESPRYDLFRTGHAGASISTALGLALASRAAGSDARTVAVIGDGALGTGLALEALNHAGDTGADLLVVLNDNHMAISPTVGALARCLTAVRATPAYGHLKAEVRQALDRVPLGGRISRALHTVKESLKELVLPDHALEHFGFRCFGPVDGHHLGALLEALEEMKRLAGPRLLHVHTRKGHGFVPASEKPEAWHATAPFVEKDGEVVPAAGPPGRATWTDAAAEELLRLAAADERIVAITAAMPEGTGLAGLARRFPRRFYDVGISEEHAVGLAAGLARGGLRPVVGIYSTFLQRSYDQLFQEVALQGLPVVFLVDRAGLVGEDGPTHHGLYDVAYMRHLPGLTLAAPADRGELRGMMASALAADGPWAIRYPRDRLPEQDFSADPVRPGRGAILRHGKDGAILAYGAMAGEAVGAADRLAARGIRVAVASARFAKPVDADLLAALLSAQPFVVTVEDHALPGGFGSAVLEAAEAGGLDGRKVHRLAAPDAFIEHDSRRAQQAAAGLTADGVAACVEALRRTAGTD